MKIEIGVCLAAAPFARSLGVGDVGGGATPDAAASAPGAALSVFWSSFMAEDEDDEEFVEDAIVGSDTMKEFWDSLERNSRRRKSRKTEFHYVNRLHQIPNYIGSLTVTDLELTTLTEYIHVDSIITNPILKPVMLNFIQDYNFIAKLQVVYALFYISVDRVTIILYTLYVWFF